VGRDRPLVQGALTVALSEGLRQDDDVEVIVDRRSGVSSAEHPSATAPEGQPERRLRSGAERRLLHQGYVIVPLGTPAGPSRSADGRRRERTRAVPWRGLITVGAALAIIVAIACILPFAGRLAPRLWNVVSAWPESLRHRFTELRPWPERAPAPRREDRDPAAPGRPSPRPPSPAPATGAGESTAVGATGGGDVAVARRAPTSAEPTSPPPLPPRVADRPADVQLPPPREAPRDARQSAREAAPFKRSTTVRAAASSSGFPGVPQVLIQWDRAPDGAAIDYAARLRDESGRPLAASEVTLFATIPGSGVRAVPLVATGDPGTYQGRLLQPGETPEDLRVRVTVHGRRFEIPTAPRASGHEPPTNGT
jgi:hypothetical protein